MNMRVIPACPFEIVNNSTCMRAKRGTGHQKKKHRDWVDGSWTNSKEAKSLSAKAGGGTKNGKKDRKNAKKWKEIHKLHLHSLWAPRAVLLGRTYKFSSPSGKNSHFTTCAVQHGACFGELSAHKCMNKIVSEIGPQMCPLQLPVVW